VNSKTHVFGKRLFGNAERLALVQLNHPIRWFISFQSVVPSTTGILAKKLDRPGLRDYHGIHESAGMVALDRRAPRNNRGNLFALPIRYAFQLGGAEKTQIFEPKFSQGE